MPQGVRFTVKKPSKFDPRVPGDGSSLPTGEFVMSAVLAAS